MAVSSSRRSVAETVELRSYLALPGGLTVALQAIGLRWRYVLTLCAGLVWFLALGAPVPAHAAAPTRLQVSADLVSATVGEGETVSLTVAVSDAGGIPTPYSGQVEVAFSKPMAWVQTGDGLNWDGERRVTLSFHEQQALTFAIRATQSGEYSAAVTAADLISDRQWITFIPADPTTATFAAQDALVPVSGPQGGAAVHLRDQFGNRVDRAGVPVRITPLQNGTPTEQLSINGQAGAVSLLTGPNGMVTFVYSTPPYAGSSYELLAIPDTVGATESAASRLRVQVVNALPASVSLQVLHPTFGNPVSTVAAGSAVTVRVRLLDALGHGVTGLSPYIRLQGGEWEWAITDDRAPAGGSELRALLWLDHGNGDYTATLYPLLAGHAALTVGVDTGSNPVGGTARVSIMPGPAAKAVVREAAGGRLCLLPGQPTSATLQLVDAVGNPVAASAPLTVHVAVDPPGSLGVRRSPEGVDVGYLTLATGTTNTPFYLMPTNGAAGTLGLEPADGALTPSAYVFTASGGCAAAVAPPQPAIVGLPLEVPLLLQGADDLAGWLIDVAVPSGTARIDAVLPGQGWSSSLNVTEQAVTGLRATLGAAVAAGEPGISGSVELARVRLTPLVPGSTALQVNYFSAWTTGGQPLTATAQATTYVRAAEGLTGRVVLAGGAAQGPAWVGVKGTTTVTSTQPDGRFLFPSLAGPVDLLVYAPGYLRSVFSAVPASGDVGQVTLQPGDADGDNTVSTADLAWLAARWGANVQLTDLAAAALHYGEEAPIEALPEPEPVVLLDGQPWPAAVPPVIRDGHLYMPVRSMAEGLSVPVIWDAELGAVTLEHEGLVYRLILNGPAYKEGIDLQWPVPAAVVVDARAMVPLELLAQAMGLRSEGGAVTGVFAFWR